MFYEFLFKSAQSGFMIIDESEISLYVGWQEKFLDDLREIVAITNTDVLLATHSPIIIGEHWDLTVELKPPPGEAGIPFPPSKEVP